MKSKTSRVTINNFWQVLLLCQLLIISQSSWAEDQVDLLTTEPILVYEISHEIIADNDTLKIEIYNDGKVLIHYPSYMKKAGDYKTLLSQSDLQRLIHTLDTPSIINFDTSDLKLHKKARDGRNRNLSFVSDSSFSSFKVSRSDEHGSENIKQIIQHPHLQLDAKNYPNIEGINRLAAVESALSNLVNQSNVQELVNE